MEAMKDYVAHLDNKKRITLRGAAYQYYNVKEYGNGCIILEPRELAVPESISARTLADMDRAVSNFKRGDVSPAIDLSELWLDLQEKYRSGNIKKKEEQLYKKWGKALKLLSADPGYPSLQTHEIEPLSRRYGMKVWQSYLENKTSGAMRMYWVYGPDQKDITIIGLEPHPEDKKNGAYDRISLSDL